MKHNIKFLFGSLAFLSALAITIYSCKKDKVVTANNEVAFFSTGSATGTYTITTATQVYKVPVGLTKIPEGPRTVAISVTSPTGAVKGTQFNLNTTTLTFDKNKVSDTIIVSAVLAQYTTGRKDSLTFTFTNPADGLATLPNTFKLAVRGPCFEGGVVMADFLGTYKKTMETFGTSGYGPYTTTITTATPTSATTGTIVVNNIWDNGWGPLTFNLDWTDAANRTATVVAQNAIPGSNAGDINSAYAGQTIAVQPFAGNPGTFSWCNGTLTLRMQLGVSSLGFFGSLYTVNLAK